MTETLSLTDHFFNEVLDNATIAGFDGYFKKVSVSWSETLGWPIDTLISRPITEFVHPDDRDGVLEHRARLHAGAVVSGLQNRYICKDGSYRWFEWRARADLERELVFAVARDITEQKRQTELLDEMRKREEKLKARLAFADRMAAVGTLAAGMAHEINNPLAPMQSNIELIREELERAADELPESFVTSVGEMLDDVHTGVRRIGKIIQQLQSFSAGSERRVEKIEIVPIVRRTADLTRREIRQRARLIEEYEVTPPVEADPSELSQVVLNLLVNAIHAIELGDAEANSVTLRTSTGLDGHAVLEVEDSGSGIPAEQIERVFDPFFTTKPVGVGTGLGLSFCHAVVERMGGQMSVESNPGEGTIFRLLLPPIDDTEVTAERRFE